MLSELVLSLALLGGIRDHLDDKGVKEAASANLANMKIHSKDDLELWFKKHHQIFREILDVNQDGEIDMYELAVLELDGAEVTSFPLSGSEALVLANGAVREDGELATDHVDQAHFQNWFVDTLWDALLNEADLDGDKALSSEEWTDYCQSANDLLQKLHAPVHLPETVENAVEKKPEKGFGFGEMDFAVPENAVEALIAAGSVFSQVTQANFLPLGTAPARRRFIFMATYALCVGVLFAVAVAADVKDAQG